MRRMVAVFLGLLAATITAFARQDAAADDGKTIQGTWKVVSCEHGGKKLPDDKVKDAVLIFADGIFTFKEGGKTITVGNYRLDPEAKPGVLDIVATEGPAKGQSQHGIYELKGDDLKLCQSFGVDRRPAEFKSVNVADEGNPRMLWIPRRVK